MVVGVVMVMVMFLAFRMRVEYTAYNMNDAITSDNVWFYH